MNKNIISRSGHLFSKGFSLKYFGEILMGMTILMLSVLLLLPQKTFALSPILFSANNLVAGETEGAFCGGIAGIQCGSGFVCKLDGTYPDAGGHCEKEDNPTTTFSDVPKTHWAYSSIEQLVEFKVIQGYSDNTFRSKAVKNFSDVDYLTDWYGQFVAYGVNTSIIEGYSSGTFRPNSPITRAEAAKIIAKLRVMAIK